ncbi:MAG: hypothetical protein IPK07_20325 [Deltaproteobacteria bacterium]|nr:hypothetical protein [Deltaproteobacteria bacterium]
MRWNEWRGAAARRGSFLAAGIAAAFAVTSCGGSGGGAATPSGVPTTAVACTTVTETCYFPFPTNLFTQPSATPTGLALDIRAANFPSPVTEAVLRTYPPELLNGNDGFSALAPVIVPLPELPDPASLPATPAASVEPDASIRIWDVDAGAPVAFRALLDDHALRDAVPHAILGLVPQAPFANGHTFVALVTDRVRTESGAPMPAFDGFRRVVDGAASATGAGSDADVVRAAYQPVLASIRGAMSEDPAHAVLATSFTVRSNEPITRKMRALTQAVITRNKANPPRFRVDQVVPPLPALETKGVENGVIGYMTAPDYRDADHRIVWDAQGRPVEQREHELEFLLKLPKAGAGRAPVVVFGHGLGAIKETLLQVSSILGERGYATIGIDVVAHGSRIGEDGFIASYFAFERLLETRDAFLQTIADEVQLVRLLQGALTSLDVAPAGGDGVPDLAPGPIAFIGQSLGTVLGGTYLAVEPAIGAGVLNVPGGGFASLLQQSDQLGSILDSFLPAGATADDRMVLIPLAQMLVDDVDPANFGPHVIEDPFPGNQPKDVLIQESMGDGIMPNTSTELLAGSLGMPQVEPELEPIFGLAKVAAPATGSGLYQFHVSDNGFVNHGFLLSRPGALDQVADFIDSRARTGTARIDAE